MATDSVMGLFTSPQQYQQGLQAEALNQGVSLARLSPVERAAAMGYAGAAQVGRGLGGMLGAEDPQMKIAAARQQVLQGLDQTDSASLAKAAQQLSSIGDVQGANALAQQAISIQSKIDEKKAAREQALILGREKIQSAEQIASERNALMAQIAQMNSALRGANSDVQRQLIEQRIEDLKVKADEKQATLQSQAQGKVAAFDSALDTLNVIATHPGKKSVVGALTGGVASMIPGTDAAGFASQLETFKAQTFIPQVAALKGMGALSDAEGKKLTAAVGALDPKMKQKEFDAQVVKIKTSLEDAKQRALNMPGMPKQSTPTAPATTPKVIKFSDL
jgi:uncharacterized protein YwgA